ncbi:MAG: rod-binding protein [Planctomycetes bacterium]|nr:rod-binding protein [Planctomycetota bacterium]
MNAIAATGTIDSGGSVRERAERTAAQFEAILVRQLVSSLRETGSVGGEGGMFGDGAGAGTYADWFDERVADHLGASGQIGIKEVIIRDLERLGQLESRTTAQQVLAARRAADHAGTIAIASRQGVLDVTR